MVVPGIGTMRAAGQEPGKRDLRRCRALLLATRLSRSTKAWFFSIASGVKRGSDVAEVVVPELGVLVIAPVRKPLPSGL